MVYFYGAYQKYELFCLRDLLKNRARPVCFDIGANVGQHSLFLSRYCDRVHAFEPYELVRRQLELKIRHNDISNIVVHDVGLGQQDSQLDYFAPRGCNTGTGSFVPSYATDNNRLIGKLQVVDADRYISGLGLAKIDLIKIDVEGYEKNVLLGLKDTLREYRPVLFMEFSAETKHSFQGEDEMMSMLPSNYGIKRVLTNRPRFAVLANPGYTFSHFDFDVSGGNIVLSPSDQ